MYLVTGASTGIGNAVAMNLATRGCEVIVVARTEHLLDSLHRKFPGQIHPVVADLATEPGISRVIESIPDGATIQGLVHAAGTLIPVEPFRSIDAVELVEHFRVHVASQISLSQQIAAKASISRMLYIDSYSAETPREDWAGYSIIKAAAQMAARCARQEFKETSIIRVYPGAVQTQIVDSVLKSKSKVADVFGKIQAEGKLSTPTEAASFITSILVDAPNNLLESIEAWDYHNTNHQEQIALLSKN